MTFGPIVVGRDQFAAAPDGAIAKHLLFGTAASQGTESLRG